MGGRVSQVKAALCAIGRYRGVSQLYCRKSRLNGPLREFEVGNGKDDLHPKKSQDFQSVGQDFA